MFVGEKQRGHQAEIAGLFDMAVVPRYPPSPTMQLLQKLMIPLFLGHWQLSA